MWNLLSGPVWRQNIPLFSSQIEYCCTYIAFRAFKNRLEGYRCRIGPAPGAHLDLLPSVRAATPRPALAVFSVASDDLWARLVTYTDNMSGMKTRPLHDLIWRPSPRDIERALFGDASSFLPVPDIHIPKFPPSCDSALCRPGDLFSPRAVPLD